jgi:uncharacterized protein YndB with AHSA1/START domain
MSHENDPFAVRCSFPVWLRRVRAGITPLVSRHRRRRITGRFGNVRSILTRRYAALVRGNRQRSGCECHRSPDQPRHGTESALERGDRHRAGRLTPMERFDRDLVLTRIIDAPREKVFRAWTDPEWLKQWFAPLPSTTPVAELDMRPGGANLIVMRGPDGAEVPNRGVTLEVIENERLVFTDAYTSAWEPSHKAFMTVILSFEDLDGRTMYTARVRHWSAADRDMHKEMGFYEGWGRCTDQLEALLRRL